MTFPECKDCYTLSEIPCEHRSNYIIIEGFIKKQEINGIRILIADVTAEPDKDYYEAPEKYWKGGNVTT
jgi:hypothetical protein